MHGVVGGLADMEVGAGLDPFESTRLPFTGSPHCTAQPAARLELVPGPHGDFISGQLQFPDSVAVNPFVLTDTESVGVPEPAKAATIQQPAPTSTTQELTSKRIFRLVLPNTFVRVVTMRPVAFPPCELLMCVLPLRVERGVSGTRLR